MTTLIAAFILISLAFIAIGTGVFFLGKKASHTPCGSVPERDTEECLSQKAGICPIEDKTGALKMQRKTRLH